MNRYQEAKEIYANYGVDTEQALNALKSEVANCVTDKVVSQAVDSLAADSQFLGQFAVALAQKWVQDEPIVISSSEAESLKSFFAAKAKELLDKGVTIEKVNVIVGYVANFL